MKKLLTFFFVVYLASRIFFSLNSEYFSDDTSYFALRQVEHIKETGKPLIHDDLSYGGRVFVLMPLYYYFMAIFSFFNSIIVLKIIQNIVASTVIITSYLLANKIIKNKAISLMCAVLISCLGIYLEKTINTIDPISLVIPASLLIIYLFLEAKEKLNYLIVLTLVLSISSGASIFLILSFITYVLLNYIHNKKLERIEFEYIAFFIMFFLWANFILFKNAFQVHGFRIIYQNIPAGLLENTNLIYIFGSIGIITIALGSFSLYAHLFRNKNEDLTIIASILFSILLLSWMNLISQEYSVVFMGICFIILSGQFIKDFFIFFDKSKFVNSKKYVIMVLSFLFLAQSISGIIINKASVYTPEYVAAFKLINKDLPRNSTILAYPRDGHLISYFGKMKNVMDTEYLLAKNTEIRYNDIMEFYDSKFRISSLRILEKYDADYFIVYNNTFPLSGDSCFSLVYLGDLRLYKKECEINE